MSQEPFEAGRVPKPVGRPKVWRQFGEGLSGLWVPALGLAWQSLKAEPTGRGTVLVLPGFGASDSSTFVLRSLLGKLGYQTSGWRLGLNRGNVRALIGPVVQRVEEAAEAAGEPIALVGQSLGGYLSREAARERPELVRRVITLGSPVVGGPRHSSVAPLYALVGTDFEEISAAIREREQVPLQVPVTAVFSKRDGVVLWQACIDRTSPAELIEHVEVSSTHLAMGIDPEVLRIVARRLAL